jgi:hypothetical protein
MGFLLAALAILNPADEATIENTAKLFCKGIESVNDNFYLGGETVIRDNRWNSRK